MANVSLPISWPIRIKFINGKYYVCNRELNFGGYVKLSKLSDYLFQFEREVVDILGQTVNDGDYSFYAITKRSGDDSTCFIDKISYNRSQNSVSCESSVQIIGVPVFIFRSLYAYKTGAGVQVLINFDTGNMFIGDVECMSEYMRVVKESIGASGILSYEELPSYKNDSVVTFIGIKPNIDNRLCLNQIVVDRRMISLPHSRRYHVRAITDYVDVEQLAQGMYQGVHVDSSKGLSIINVNGIYGNKQGIIACHIEREIRTHLKKCGREIKSVVSKVKDCEKTVECELIVDLGDNVNLCFNLLIDKCNPFGYSICNKYFEVANNNQYLKLLDSKLDENVQLDRLAFWKGLDKIKFDGAMPRYSFTGVGRSDSGIYGVSSQYKR